ncbi:cAMP-dependent protein kinase [Sarracenia purpurea var. burkii]
MEKSEGTVQMDFLVGSIAVTAVYVAPPMELMIENNKVHPLITIAEVIDNEWFKKGYKPPSFEQADVSLDDVDAIFNESGDSTNLVVERREERPANPVSMNAFELISKSQGLNLSSLFEKQMGLVKRETRFTSKCPASEVISKIEEAAVPLGFDVKKNNYKFYKNMATGLKDIVWKSGEEAKEEANDGAGSHRRFSCRHRADSSPAFSRRRRIESSTPHRDSHWQSSPLLGFVAPRRHAESSLPSPSCLSQRCRRPASPSIVSTPCAKSTRADSISVATSFRRRHSHSNIITGICKLHQQGLTHGGISTRNIFIVNGIAKLGMIKNRTLKDPRFNERCINDDLRDLRITFSRILDCRDTNPELDHFLQEASNMMGRLDKLVFHPILMDTTSRSDLPVQAHIKIVAFKEFPSAYRYMSNTRYGWISAVNNYSTREQAYRDMEDERYNDNMWDQLFFVRNCYTHISEYMRTRKTKKQVEYEVTNMFPDFLINLFDYFGVKDLEAMLQMQ